MKKIKIALIGLNKLPIPNTKGGAIEAAVTLLMDLNEKYKSLDFTVFSIEDSSLNDVVKKYNHSKVIQIQENGFAKYKILFYKCLRKLSRYKLPMKSVYMDKVNNLLINNNFDVVDFFSSNEFVAQLSPKVKSKVLYHVYSDYLTSSSYGINDIINRITYFVANDYLSSRIKEELKCDNNKVYPMNGGMDLKILDKFDSFMERNKIRERENVKDSDVLIVYCGRLSPEKGPLELIKAMQKVKGGRLILVGGSTFSSNEETSYVKQLKEEANKCNGRVNFTGYLPNHDDVYRYMFAADIGVVPSICNEAGSAANCEFRLAKIPTIISDKGGMKIFSNPKSLVVRCDENYVDNLSSAIQKLIDDPILRKDISNASYNDIENFSLEKFWNDYVTMVNSLI